MRYPDFLKKNGTIGFVAPAFGCAIEPYKSGFGGAKQCFGDMGYKISEGPNCSQNSGIGISNTPEKCGEELNSFYADPSTDILISCGGGELMCEVVPYIDFDLIASSRPKWFMGYSDNTNFTFLSATLADTAAIYGPCAAAFGMKPWHKSLHDAMSLLTGESCHDKTIGLRGYDSWEIESMKTEESPFEPYNTTEKSRIICLPDGHLTEYTEDKPISVGDITMSGRLLGGCLDCLEHLIGTKYDKVSDFSEKYTSEGILWFLEACDLGPMDVRRTIWHMRQAGWFDNAKGFLIGRPYRYAEEMMGVDMYNAVVDIISDLDLPIILDADVGHHPPMLPLICGSMASIATNGNDYSVSMRLV